jgi:hypothetical protein
MAFYIVTFEVTGKTNFPLDMLRYDRCFPVRGEDADSIGQSLRSDIRIKEKVDGLPDGVFRIRLERVTMLAAPGVTSARWSSFGWSVDPESIKIARV